MIKKNKLLIGCLSLLLVLSIGYALFSEQVTINGTATAKGSFDIDVQCFTIMPDEIKTSLENEEDFTRYYADNGYNNESCSVTDNVVNYSVSLDYPGASKWFAIKFLNEGTIDAGLSIEDYQKNNFGEGIVTLKTYDIKTDKFLKEEVIGGVFTPTEVIYFEREDGSYVDINELSESELGNFVDENNELILLKSGSSWYYVYVFHWPKGWTRTGEYYKVSFELKFPFVQVTN